MKNFSVNHFPKHFTPLLSLSLAQWASVLPKPPPCPSSPSQKSPSPLVFFSQTPTSSWFGYQVGTGADLQPTWARGGYDRRGLEMVAMGCRSLGFTAVASESGHWALPISLSPDCVMICGFWFVCFGLFLVLIEWIFLWLWVFGFFFMVVCSGLRWWVCNLQWVFYFYFYYFFFWFFSFYVVPNTIKYFSDYFLECNQTQEKKLFSLKSFTFANILW